MKGALCSIALSAGVTVLLILAARTQPVPTLPAKADLTTLNCLSIFSMKRVETAMVLAWLQRHYANVEASKILDQETVFDYALKLNSFCESNPDKTVMQAADSLFGSR